MAIQQINLGSAPSGTGGDTQRAANTKINQNFSNSEHAASRLVGNTLGKIPKVDNTDVGLGGWGLGTSTLALQTKKTPADVRNLTTGIYSYSNEFSVISSSSIGVMGLHFGWFNNADTGRDAVGITFDRGSRRWVSYEMRTEETTPTLHTFYTTRNTTIENGYLKPSSPVLRLQHDSFIKEHEAEQLDIRVDNPEKGVYKIAGTTGLRKDDGWYFTPPKDEHMNVLCFVEVEEEGEVIIVKTYAKKFDFETVSIVPDYDNPVDIPDSGDLLLRFNDLPQEQLDEPIE